MDKSIANISNAESIFFTFHAPFRFVFFCVKYRKDFPPFDRRKASRFNILCRCFAARREGYLRPFRKRCAISVVLQPTIPGRLCVGAYKERCHVLLPQTDRVASAQAASSSDTNGNFLLSFVNRCFDCRSVFGVDHFIMIIVSFQHTHDGFFSAIAFISVVNTVCHGIIVDIK